MKNHSNLIFVVVIGIICVILGMLPTGFENPILTESTIRVKGKVTSVENDDLKYHSIVLTGTQRAEVVILRGDFKGDTLPVKNVMMGQMKLDKVYKPGDKVLVVAKVNKEKNKIQTARIDDHYRISIEWILVLIFSLFLIGFARFTGFKALLSFVFTALMIWKIMLPMFLKGYSPIPVALVIIVILTSVIIMLVSGFSKKGIVALTGAISGIVVTSILALVFGHFFKIPGAVQEFSETILYMGFSDIDLGDVFIACIFISAAGAVMDVAMDIAAAQNEILENTPDISRKKLINSGFQVAYPVIGTMTTTLLFAYSGSFMFVFMSFMSQGTPLTTVFNTNYIAAEILHTLVCSFGLVLVAPLTAIIGGIVFTRKKSLQ